MVSNSFRRWDTVDRKALDQLEAAHRGLGGASRGRRYAVEQVNHAFAVLLSARFQGFCRSLHSEAADHCALQVLPLSLRSVFRNTLTASRKLDRGNPNPGNIGADFGSLGLPIWPAVYALDPKNLERQAHLEELNLWRNAIAHQDFDSHRLKVTVLRLDRVRHWRRTCHQLALSFDEVTRQYLINLTGSAPW
jgi:hypothetical protein